MIVSHKHRFIFVKTRKTAGTSVEIALSVHCGAHDVITPVLPEDEELRSQAGGRGPQHYKRSILRYRPRDWKRLVVDRQRQDFKNHLPGPRIRQMLPGWVWGSYYKFTIERNPWDKVISGYYWTEAIRKREGRPSLTLPEFVASDYHLNNYRDWDRYTENGKLIVDRVLRFENLVSELAEVSDYLGIPRLTLPRAKAGHRIDKRPYWEVLTRAQIDRIATVYAPEIAHGEYCRTFTWGQA